MSQAPAPATETHHTLGHIVPLRVLTAVFLALVFLTVVTVAASRIDLGPLNLYLALGIAGTKALLVVLYFMHLRYDRPFNLFIFAGCLVFVVGFISMVLKDTQTYQPSMEPGQAKSMQDVHTPFGR
jgi:cytochrome c oxidase subunit IV